MRGTASIPACISWGTLVQIKAVTGGLNVSEATVVANVKAALRRQLPQVRPYQPQGTPLALVAGGPSLLATIEELRECVFHGAQVAAVNGAYEWCIRHNIKPSVAILLDARPENAEMLAAPVPGCKYLLASQCAPETFDMVAGRDAWIFHALSYEEAESALLDAYYGPDRYAPVTGGSTVTIRALSLLRMLGFLRMDLFGFDSCWMDLFGTGLLHHAYTQVLNDNDKQLKVQVQIDGVSVKEFICAPWHLKQWEDFQLWVKERGDLCDLHVHGEGLIAYMMKRGARLIRESNNESRSGAAQDAGVSDASHHGGGGDARTLVSQD